MEHFTKIIYLLSLFFPVMFFFTVGLWIAWTLWFKHSRDFHEALEEHHRLVAELNELYINQYQLTEQYEGLEKSSNPAQSPPLAPPNVDPVAPMEVNSNTESDEINILKEELNGLRKLLKETDADAQIDSLDSFSDIYLVEKILTDFADEPVRNCPDFGIIYSEKPDSCDELTRIATLTTNDAVRLNQLGIYCFRQIALWTPNHSEAIKQHLQLNDGIDPKNWQTQASNLQ